ncbi:hypothetical protein D5047_20875 [Verminephrobacter eiseniae]|nr:hypothetical protein [Verminephrobacter eiseniae]
MIKIQKIQSKSSQTLGIQIPEWLAKHYSASPVQAFRTDGAIATSRATVTEDGYVRESMFASITRPQPGPRTRWPVI